MAKSGSADTRTEKYSPTDQDVTKYLQAQRELLETNPKAELTFNQYLQDQYFHNQDVTVVANLSNRTFSGIDLSGGDFSGCTFQQTKFIKCDLASAVFCDVDFDEVYFEDSVLKNIDLRGADLANCQFSDKYKNYDNLGKGSEIDGIKFSATAPVVKQYANIKSELEKQKEKESLIADKETELQEVYKDLTWKQAGWLAAGRATGNEKYDKLAQELADMQAGKFVEVEKDRQIHRTLQNVFSTANDVFDPAYIRGSSKAERGQEVQYTKLTRQDVAEYLIAVKKKQDLSLNDFAKSKMDPSQVKAGAKVVADCSGLDLSGLVFDGADLSGAVFTGSDLSNSQFINKCKISKASFEGTNLHSAQFEEVDARSANFFAANLTLAQITDSDFSHSIMTRSIGESLIVKKSNFDYANIKKGKWSHADLLGSQFNHANLESISLESSNISKSQMQAAILNKATLTKCKLREVNLSNALMYEASVQEAKFKDDTVLKGIQARAMDLSGAELDSSTKLDGANLQLSKLKGVQAEGVSFAGANLSMIEAQDAILTGAILEGVDARFANFSGATLENLKAAGINLSNSNLQKVKAKKADFSSGVMRRVNGENADFTETVFTDTKLTDARLPKATLAILPDVGAKEASASAVGQSWFARARNVAVDVTRVLPTLTHVGDLKGLYDNYSAWAQSNNDLWFGNLRVEDKAAVVQKNVEGMLGIIKNAGTVLNHQASRLQGANSELFKTQVAQYSIIPTLNFLFTPIPYISSSQAAPGTFDMFNGVVSDTFISNLGALTLDLLPGVGKANEAVRALYQNIMVPDENIQMTEQILSILDTPDISRVLTDSLVKFLKVDENREAITKITAYAVESRYPEFQSNDLFVNTVSLAIDSVTPILANLPTVAYIYRKYQSSQSLEAELLSGKELSEERRKEIAAVQDENIVSILAEANKVLVGLSPVLAQNLPEYLTKNKEDILKVFDTESAHKTFESYGIDSDLAKDLAGSAIPLVADALPIVINHGIANLPTVADIYRKYQSSQSLNAELLDGKELSAERRKEIALAQRESMSAILEEANKVLLDVSPVLTKNLPEYLTNNQGKILEVLNTQSVQNALKSYSIDPEFLKEIGVATIPFIADALPILVDFTEICMDDQQSRNDLLKIMENAQMVMNNESPSEQSAKLQVFVESLVQFHDSRPEVQDVLKNKIPDLLTKHAPTLVPVIDKFINQTDIGKKLKIQGKDVLDAVVPHSKDLQAIANAYVANKGYGAMVRPILNLLSDRKVLSLIASSGLNLFKYNWQKNWVSHSTRRKVVGKEIQDIITGLNDSVDANKDLSFIFQNVLKERKKAGPVNAIVDHSLGNRDLQGLSFKGANIKLDGYTLQGFDMGKVVFGECSLKGAVLENCSFKSTVFTKGVNFDGAAIDGNTLKTLIPAVEKYNKKHAQDPISLDKIKVVGEIDFDILIKLKNKNPNLSFAQANVKLDGRKMKGTNLDNVTFGECSLKDTTLKNCSFNGAVFTKKVNFDGATIDGSTLKTLIPAIEVYNKKHEKNPINLDKIKIVGKLPPELEQNSLLSKAILPKLNAVHVTEKAEPNKQSLVGVNRAKGAEQSMIR